MGGSVKMKSCKGMMPGSIVLHFHKSRHAVEGDLINIGLGMIDSLAAGSDFYRIHFTDPFESVATLAQGHILFNSKAKLSASQLTEDDFFCSCMIKCEEVASTGLSIRDLGPGKSLNLSIRDRIIFGRNLAIRQSDVPSDGQEHLVALYGNDDSPTPCEVWAKAIPGGCLTYKALFAPPSMNGVKLLISSGCGNPQTPQQVAKLAQAIAANDLAVTEG
jgi:hypothetical protein